MKHLLFLLVFTLPTFAQITHDAPYGFRDDVIGESLQDFRTRNSAECSGDSHPGVMPQMPDFSKVKPNQIASASAAYSDALSAYQRSIDPVVMTLDGALPGTGEDKVCSIKDGVDIAGAGGSAQFWVKDDRLDMITGGFRQEYFDQVKAAIVAKYGNPGKIEARNYYNNAGAQLQGEVDTWSRPDSYLELDQVKVGDSGTSSLLIANPESLKEHARKIQATANSRF